MWELIEAAVKPQNRSQNAILTPNRAACKTLSLKHEHICVFQRGEKIANAM